MNESFSELPLVRAQCFSERQERENIMTVIEVKAPRVPLCPVHLIGMVLADLKLVWPFANEVGTVEVSRCLTPGCAYTFSPTHGYFRFCAGGNINSEEGFLFVCPVHRGTLYISEYDREGKIATWHCPHVGCETSKKSRLG